MEEREKVPSTKAENMCMKLYTSKTQTSLNSTQQARQIQNKSIYRKCRGEWKQREKRVFTFKMHSFQSANFIYIYFVYFFVCVGSSYLRLFFFILYCFFVFSSCLFASFILLCVGVRILCGDSRWVCVHICIRFSEHEQNLIKRKV